MSNLSSLFESNSFILIEYVMVGLAILVWISILIWLWLDMKKMSKHQREEMEKNWDDYYSRSRAKPKGTKEGTKK